MSNSSRKAWQEFLGFTRLEIAAAGPVPLVVTREGVTRPFYLERIKATLSKTLIGVRGADDPDLVQHLTNQVLHDLNGTPDIEAIQDRIEVALIEGNHADLAKGFILYRERHAALRDSKRLLLDIGDTMEGYLSGADWRVKENANVNYSLGGLILHNSGTLTANYWLRNV